MSVNAEILKDTPFLVAVFIGLFGVPIIGLFFKIGIWISERNG